MKLISYARTSTDDKGQRPERQHEQNRAWAARHGGEVVLMVGDDGVSGVTPWQSRHGLLFVPEHYDGVDGIIITSVDRLTRAGPEEFWVSIRGIREAYGLDVYFTNMAPDASSYHSGVVWTIDALSAAGWLENHRAATKAGMASKGVTGGRPRKLLTEAELERVGELRLADVGWRKVAAIINEDRGVHQLATPEARRRRSISYKSIQTQAQEAGIA